MIPIEKLSAYLDGDLEPEERAEIEARLGAEPESQAALAELREMVSAGPSLSEAPVPAALWSAIDAELDRAERAPWAALLEWLRPAAPRAGWALAGAAAMALVAVSVGPSPTPEPEDPAPARATHAVEDARRVYEGAIEDLEQRAEAATARLPEQTRKELKVSLAGLDEAILSARRILREHDGSVEGQRLLLSLYEEKVRVLDRVVRFTDYEGVTP